MPTQRTGQKKDTQYYNPADLSLEAISLTSSTGAIDDPSVKFASPRPSPNRTSVKLVQKTTWTTLPLRNEIDNPQIYIFDKVYQFQMHQVQAGTSLKMATLAQSANTTACFLRLVANLHLIPNLDDRLKALKYAY